MNEMKKWVNKRCRIFVRSLSDKPIIYTGMIISVDDNFITIHDKEDKIIGINLLDLIQIREEENV